MDHPPPARAALRTLAMAVRRKKTTLADPFKLTPIYIRRPEAEEKAEAKK